MFLVFLSALGWAGLSDFAQGADLDGDDVTKTASTLPNIYLDVRTIYPGYPPIRSRSISATILARLAFGWLARLYREGIEPSGSR